MREYFDKLLQNLEPTETFGDIIQIRHAAVRSQLATGVDSKLIGSLQRRTRIQPLPGQPFDIDILVVLDKFIGWNTPGGISAYAAISRH